MEAIELNGNSNDPSQSYAVDSRSGPTQNHSKKKSIVQRTSAWWQQYISPELIIDRENQHNVPARDFLALERLHLAYVRSSNLIAQFAVIVIQVILLRSRQMRKSSPSSSLRHRPMIRAATALAVLSICVALVVVLRGAMRYFYLQRLMTKKMGRYKCAGVMGIGLLAGLGLVMYAFGLGIIVVYG